MAPRDPSADAPLELVERMAVLFETEGLSRIAGRIFGLLLLSDSPRSLGELAQTLGASRASISTETRLLERRGLLERVGRPGDRRHYYQVSPELPIRSLELRLERMHRFRSAIAEARRALPRAAAPVRERLREIDIAYEHVFGAIDHTLAAWKRQRARRATR